MTTTSVFLDFDVDGLEDCCGLGGSGGKTEACGGLSMFCLFAGGKRGSVVFVEVGVWLMFADWVDELELPLDESGNQEFRGGCIEEGIREVGLSVDRKENGLTEGELFECGYRRGIGVCIGCIGCVGVVAEYGRLVDGDSGVSFSIAALCGCMPDCEVDIYDRRSQVRRILFQTRLVYLMVLIHLLKYSRKPRKGRVQERN